MAARKTPSKGAKPDKLVRDALMVAINREAKDANGKPTKRLNLMVEKLVELGIEGNIAAIKEIADRLDGKATQPISSDPDHPIHMQVTNARDMLWQKLDQMARHIKEGA